MDNLVLVDEETIPMAHQDEDYDDYNTPNTSKIDVTSFTVPDATDATSTLKLRQKVKRDKLTVLYRHLNVTGNLEMESIPMEDLFSLAKDIHVKTREASKNTDFDMREFLGIDKALQSI